MQPHFLAELFPPLDEQAFQRLADSILANGQLDPITTYNGQILDGRARFRACEKIGIPPTVTPFLGSDPLRFVIEKNLQRQRPLNQSQRGLIAARIATLAVGRPNAGIPAISQTDAAKLLGVSRDTVTAARAVLTWGSPEVIAQIESGKARVGIIARVLRREQQNHAEIGQRMKTGKNPERIQRQRMNAEIWGRVRDALSHLTSLPLASDVVFIVRTNDKAGLVNKRLAGARRWLEEFAHAWERSHGQAQTGRDHLDAGDGERTPGVQHDQSPTE